MTIPPSASDVTNWPCLEAFSPTPSVLLFVDIRLLSRQELGAATKVWESSMHLRWRWWSYLDLFGRHHCMIFCLLLSGSAELLGSAPVMTWSNCTLDITGHDGTGMIKTLKRSLSDLSQRSAFKNDSIDSHGWRYWICPPWLLSGSHGWLYSRVSLATRTAKTAQFCSSVWKCRQQQGNARSRLGFQDHRLPLAMRSILFPERSHSRTWKNYQPALHTVKW